MNIEYLEIITGVKPLKFIKKLKYYKALTNLTNIVKHNPLYNHKHTN